MNKIRMPYNKTMSTQALTPISPAILALAACFLAASCTGGAMDRADLALGTVCSIRILDGGSEKALDKAFIRLKEIETSMSANVSGTFVAAVNENAGKVPVSVPSDVRQVASAAIKYAKISQGAFDPTIGPIVKLWNIGMDGERVPEPEEITAALPLINWNDVKVDESAGTIFLQREGMLLDLGAIAKGYAADEVGRILLENRVKAAVIDLGGNIKVVGKKSDGSKWRVGIQNPFDDRGDYLGIATLEGGSTVVTSGIYERFFFGDDGERYHHIFDTRTGYPISNGLVSVTIITGSSIDADGLSTTTFSMGLTAGMALIESMAGVEAVFIDEEKRLYMSSGAKLIFELKDTTFIPSELP